MIHRLTRFLRTISVPALGVSISFLIGLCYVYQPYFVRFLDNKIYDILLRRNHGSHLSDVVEIVDIDNRSLAEFGQWPWPRYRVALLLQKLREAGARAVGMDILFAEPDNNSPKVLQRSLKKDLDVDIGFADLPPVLEDNDALLADILKQGPFVLGFFFDFDSREQADRGDRLKPIPLSIVRQNTSSSEPVPLLNAPNAIVPLPILGDSAPSSGYINTVKDRDGILRATPLVMAHGDQYYANLGLATLWLGLGRPPLILKVNASGVESLRIGQSVVPLDRNGRFTLHFRGKQRTFAYHSAADVLHGITAAAQLRGKLVLIGTSAVGLEDLRTTPLDTYFPGVEAQATVIDNILTGDFIRAPDWVPGLELLITIVAGLSVLVLVYLVRTMIVLPTVLTLGILCWIGSEWTFQTHHFFISPLFPLASLFVTFTMLTFWGMYRTEHEKAYIRRAFSRYVAPSLVDRIAEQTSQLNLDGEEKHVTILFADVREFTALSENLSPTEVTTLLNQYLTPVTRIIREHQGTLDKFIGDAVMAFWNAPVDVEDHERQALTAGLDILAALPGLNDMFAERYGLRISVGIGLHAGRVRVGNMGSDDLFDYTILGDNVNLTSRLEGLTRYYGIDIIVSETLRDIVVDGFTSQQLDRVRVKGKEAPVTLFTYRPSATCSADELEAWERGLELYRQGDFAPAAEIFADLAGRLPEVPFYRLFEKRCRRWVADPPQGWDGIFIHERK